MNTVCYYPFTIFKHMVMKFSISSTTWFCSSNVSVLLIKMLLIATPYTTYAQITVFLFTAYPEVFCSTALYCAKLSNVYLLTISVNETCHLVLIPVQSLQMYLAFILIKLKQKKTHTCPKSNSQQPENWTTRLLAEMCHPAVTGSWFITRVHKHLVSTFILQPQSEKN